MRGKKEKRRKKKEREEREERLEREEREERLEREEREKRVPVEKNSRTWMDGIPLGIPVLLSASSLFGKINLKN